MESPLITKIQCRCRFCAEEKNYTDVLDLQGDIKTLEEYKVIIEYLKIDFVDLSQANSLPKTTCEKCHDAFQDAYRFFKVLECIQSTLRNSSCFKAKKDTEPSYPLLNQGSVSCSSEDSLNFVFSKETPSQSSKSFEDISSCRFCAGKRNNDLINLMEYKTFKDYEKIANFFKFDYLNLEQKNLPKTSCEICYGSLRKAYVFLNRVKGNQLSLDHLYNVNTEVIQHQINIKDELMATMSKSTDNQNPQSKETNIVPLSVLSLNYSIDRDNSWTSYVYICSHCQVVYDSMKELKTHSKDKHGVCNALRCADCKDKFGKFSDFVDHVRWHREDLRLYCEFCNTPFDTPQECSEHVNTHYIGTQKICDLCGELLPYQNTLEWHQRLYGGVVVKEQPSGLSWEDYEWVCQECSLPMPDIASLRTHSQLLHNTCFSTKCADCPETLNSYKGFVAHVLVHRPYLRNFCQFCNRHCADAGALNQHVLEHISSQQRPCADCGQTFKNNSQLAKHKDSFTKRVARGTKLDAGKRATKRTNKQKKSVNNAVSAPRRRKPKEPLSADDLTCKMCGKMFDNLLQISRHIKTHDEHRPRDFQCKLCDKAFLARTSLRDHVKTHGGKTELCHVCKNSFHTKHQLKMHIVTHFEEKPFICSECGKNFKTKRRLTCHLKSHSDIKPYKCSYCFKDFKFNENLKRHKLQHTGLRPYACEMCDKTFTNWTNCNKHMLRKHQVTLARTKITSQGRMGINRVTGEVQDIANDEKTRVWLNEMMKKEKPGKKTVRM